MMSKLKEAGHALTSEQQVQAIISSLSHSQEHIKVHLTYNIEIKTFDDNVHHLELEEDQMESSRLETEAYVANVRAQKNQDSKYKFKGRRGKGKASKKPKTNQQGKVPVTKDKSKLKCFNCGNK